MGMRIGVISTSFPRFPGDLAGTFVAEHVDWLARAGHEIEVICAGDGREQNSHLGCQFDGRVKVTRIARPGELFFHDGAPDSLKRSRLHWLHAAQFSASMVSEVARASKRWGCAIAHWLVPSAASLLLTSRVPMAAIAHSGDVHLLHQLRMTNVFARLFLRRRARMIFVSRELQQRFAAGLSARWRAPFYSASTVTSMGIHVAKWGRQEDSVRTMPTRRVSSAGKQIAYLGRLVPVKGVAILLRAVRRLPHVRVAIAGAGPQRSELVALAQRVGVSWVDFMGSVRGGARRTLFAQSDVVVIPSVRLADGRTEGFPRVLLEAMAAGVPVVASEVGGMGDVPPEAIFLVPPGEPDTLADAIHTLLNNPHLARRQVARAQEFVATRDWSVVGPKLMP